MTTTTTLTGQAEALFVSSLQPSDHPTAAEVAAAIEGSMVTFGGLWGCAAALAAEYGEHPETAAARMRWALSLATTTSAPLAMAAA